ncbi:copper resistance protein CopC [Pseudonocardia eucalypti]|uniref:Copper resistance protein CopC n=1 Tax=Pseudonocardia eucalypti TaxID=648755 RepID=A0ABP9PC81_9PSEU|nr:methionine-rich copper-binding protein CopC [Pseudonocardia eucalypti]
MRGFGRRIAGPLLGLLGIAALLVGGAGAALAHNVLVSSDPPDGAQLATGPSQLTLRFDLPVKESFSTVTVVGPDGKHFEAAPAQVSGNSVQVAVRPLGPAGQYRVGYRIVSDDGHPVSGAISFTLTQAGPGQGVSADQAPGASGEAPAASDDQAGSGGIPAWPWILGGVLLVGAGAVVALRVGRDS